MSATIDRKNYYLAYVYFHLACLAQREVQRFTKMVADAMGTDNLRLVDSITDNIYDPDVQGTEEEFEKIFRAHDVQMDYHQQGQYPQRIFPEYRE